MAGSNNNFFVETGIFMAWPTKKSKQKALVLQHGSFALFPGVGYGNSIGHPARDFRVGRELVYGSQKVFGAFPGFSGGSAESWPLAALR